MSVRLGGRDVREPDHIHGFDFVVHTNFLDPIKRGHQFVTCGHESGCDVLRVVMLRRQRGNDVFDVVLDIRHIPIMELRVIAEIVGIHEMPCVVVVSGVRVRCHTLIISRCNPQCNPKRKIVSHMFLTTPDVAERQPSIAANHAYGITRMSYGKDDGHFQILNPASSRWGMGVHLSASWPFFIFLPFFLSAVHVIPPPSPLSRFCCWVRRYDNAALAVSAYVITRSNHPRNTVSRSSSESTTEMTSDTDAINSRSASDR